MSWNRGEFGNDAAAHRPRREKEKCSGWPMQRGRSHKIINIVHHGICIRKEWKNRESQREAGRRGGGGAQSHQAKINSHDSLRCLIGHQSSVKRCRPVPLLFASRQNSWNDRWDYQPLKTWASIVRYELTIYHGIIMQASPQQTLFRWQDERKWRKSHSHSLSLFLCRRGIDPSELIIIGTDGPKKAWRYFPV